MLEGKKELEIKDGKKESRKKIGLDPVRGPPKILPAGDQPSRLRFDPRPPHPGPPSIFGSALAASERRKPIITSQPLKLPRGSKCSRILVLPEREMRDGHHCSSPAFTDYPRTTASQPLPPFGTSGRVRLVLARAPGDVDLLGEGDGGIVVGDETAGGGDRAGEGDAVVDVEDAVGAARREDVAGRGDLVGLGVHLAVGPDAAARDGRLGGGGRLGVLAEVVGAVEVASHALVELGVAVVGALEDGELEAAGVLFCAVSVIVLLRTKMGARCLP